MIDRLVVVVLFGHVDLLDVTGPPEVFSILRRQLGGKSGYRVVLAAEDMEPVTTSTGVRILPDTTLTEVGQRSIDTLIVPGSATVDADRRVRPVIDDGIVDHVRRLVTRSRRIASVCIGAHILAAAGLLDGRRATTHWATAPQLAADHPEVIVDSDPIFIRDGNVWTGAGISSCLDLSLALVADDFGEEIAQKVARQLVIYLKRSGGQSQFSTPLAFAPKSRRIDELRHYIIDHAAENLTVNRLADYLHVGDRHLTRIFKKELGTTPAAYIESTRLELARNRLETSDDTMSRVATASGFGTVDTLTRSFRRTLGVTPNEYRQRFRILPAT